jgi:hypothetical protein
MQQCVASHQGHSFWKTWAAPVIYKVLVAMLNFLTAGGVQGNSVLAAVLLFAGALLARLAPLAAMPQDGRAPADDAKPAKPRHAGRSRTKRKVAQTKCTAGGEVSNMAGHATAASPASPASPPTYTTRSRSARLVACPGSALQSEPSLTEPAPPSTPGAASVELPNPAPHKGSAMMHASHGTPAGQRALHSASAAQVAPAPSMPGQRKLGRPPGSSSTCSLCGGLGHNRLSCTASLQPSRPGTCKRTTLGQLGSVVSVLCALLKRQDAHDPASCEDAAPVACPRSCGAATRPSCLAARSDAPPAASAPERRNRRGSTRGSHAQLGHNMANCKAQRQASKPAKRKRGTREQPAVASCGQTGSEGQDPDAPAGRGAPVPAARPRRRAAAVQASRTTGRSQAPAAAIAAGPPSSRAGSCSARDSLGQPRRDGVRCAGMRRAKRRRRDGPDASYRPSNPMMLEGQAAGPPALAARAARRAAARRATYKDLSSSDDDSSTDDDPVRGDETPAPQVQAVPDAKPYPSKHDSVPAWSPSASLEDEALAAAPVHASASDDEPPAGQREAARAPAEEHEHVPAHAEQQRQQAAPQLCSSGDDPSSSGDYSSSSGDDSSSREVPTSPLRSRSRSRCTPAQDAPAQLQHAHSPAATATPAVSPPTAPIASGLQCSIEHQPAACSPRRRRLARVAPRQHATAVLAPTTPAAPMHLVRKAQQELHRFQRSVSAAGSLETMQQLGEDPIASVLAATQYVDEAVKQHDGGALLHLHAAAACLHACSYSGLSRPGIRASLRPSDTCERADETHRFAPSAFCAT